MGTLILFGAIITIVIGLVSKLVLDRRQSKYRIDKKELTVAMLVMLLIVVPLTAFIGVKVAIQNQVTYNENWNGWELSAELIKESTYEDGPMRHYWIETRMEWVDEEYEETYTDPETGETKTRTRTRRVQKPVDYRIPYTTEEWTFVVRTTIGTVQIAHRFLPENPNNYRYRWGVSVPSHPNSTGYHDFWLDVRERLRRNEPGPVTLRRTYDNYILASQSELLKRFNDSVELYEQNGQLPAINASVERYYFSDRVYFVGVRPPGDWQEAAQHFNAALGHRLQGDLHLVIVDANTITNRDNYGGALMAYWQSEKFGKDALSKNGIVVILGTSDGSTVDWAIGYTGMPLGNEMMLQEIRNLKGVDLSPDSILGSPTAALSGDSVKVTPTKSALERIVLYGNNKFERVNMTSGDEGEAVGFEYLIQQLEPTTGQKIGILVIITLFASGAWGICIAFGPESYRRLLHRLKGYRY